MKPSFGMLRKLGLHKGVGKEKTEYQASGHSDELAQVEQDMQSMRSCYDSLLCAAAATANSAYEFSDSLGELGTCLLEKTAPNADQESGGVLSMLGKVHFELQKLADSYRSHIFLTITAPSESLLNELRTVEEMKLQCDEKRSLYEYMMAQQREKGRSKSVKGENFTVQDLQTARDQYDEEATLCVFRLKSLKQGQSRSLLTQAARHHAAQLNFFRKGLKSLEAVEPHVRMVTEQQHIDYQFNGLEDDNSGGLELDVEDEQNNNDDGELSFDYRDNKLGLDAGHSSRNSIDLQLEQSDVLFCPASMVEDAGADIEPSHGELQVFGRETKASSHSAPLFAEKKIDPVERARQLHPSSGTEPHTYVLPLPSTKSPASVMASSSIPLTRRTSDSILAHNRWHSTPLDLNMHGKDSGDDYQSGHDVIKGKSVLKDGNDKRSSTQLPPPLLDSLVQHSSGSDKVKRQAFSGPVSNKPFSTKPAAELPQSVTEGLLRASTQASFSPKGSPSASPPVSSPRKSELHVLPRPPVIPMAKMPKSSNLIGNSAPLDYQAQEPFTGNRVPSAVSPLPVPPLSMQRSFSIPSRNRQERDLQTARLLESSQARQIGIVSDPLASMPLKSTKPK